MQTDWLAWLTLAVAGGFGGVTWWVFSDAARRVAARARRRRR